MPRKVYLYWRNFLDISNSQFFSAIQRHLVGEWEETEISKFESCRFFVVTHLCGLFCHQLVSASDSAKSSTVKIYLLRIRKDGRIQKIGWKESTARWPIPSISFSINFSRQLRYTLLLNYYKLINVSRFFRPFLTKLLSTSSHIKTGSRTK